MSSLFFPLNAHAAEKVHCIDRKTLGKYADKFHQVEYIDMKFNNVTTTVARSSVTEIGQAVKKNVGQWLLILVILLHETYKNGIWI